MTNNINLRDGKIHTFDVVSPNKFSFHKEAVRINIQFLESGGCYRVLCITEYNPFVRGKTEGEGKFIHCSQIDNMMDFWDEFFSHLIYNGTVPTFETEPFFHDASYNKKERIYV